MNSGIEDSGLPAKLISPMLKRYQSYVRVLPD